MIRIFALLTLAIAFLAQNGDCGGGYIKLMASDADLADFHGETPYHVMFGPDICGPGTKKVHVIFNYKGKNLLTKNISCKGDEFTHLYTLIVRSDNTYEVLIDNEKAESGDLEADWDFLGPKKIKDPDAMKPEDWDDNEFIDDPEDKKPERIPDPDAKKPEEWDDEMDGEWEPPMIDNPDYKGDWKPKQMKNPAYKGVWVHPEIDNPEYAPDDDLYLYKDIGAVGFDPNVMSGREKRASISSSMAVMEDDLEEMVKTITMLQGKMSEMNNKLTAMMEKVMTAADKLEQLTTKIETINNANEAQPQPNQGCTLTVGHYCGGVFGSLLVAVVMAVIGNFFGGKAFAKNFPLPQQQVVAPQQPQPQQNLLW